MNARKVNIDLINGSPHFSRAEIERGDKDAMAGIDPDYLKAVIDFRGWHGRSTLISSFYRAGDSGAHGEGRASDQVLFEQYGVTPCSPIEMYTRATQWPFTGVGLYLDWGFTNTSTGKVEPTPGIHVDRATTRTRPLRWVAASYLAGQPVTPLILGGQERKKAKRVFYYQDPADGLFKAQGVSKSYSLAEFIDLHDQRI